MGTALDIANSSTATQEYVLQLISASLVVILLSLLLYVITRRRINTALLSFIFVSFIIVITSFILFGEVIDSITSYEVIAL